MWEVRIALWTLKAGVKDSKEPRFEITNILKLFQSEINYFVNLEQTFHSVNNLKHTPSCLFIQPRMWQFEALQQPQLSNFWNVASTNSHFCDKATHSQDAKQPKNNNNSPARYNPQNPHKILLSARRTVKQPTHALRDDNIQRRTRSKVHPQD